MDGSQDVLGTLKIYISKILLKIINTAFNVYIHNLAFLVC